MTSTCGLAALLRPGGPVRVPLRECCAAALVGAETATPCTAVWKPTVPQGPIPALRAAEGAPVTAFERVDGVPVPVLGRVEQTEPAG